MQNLWVCLWTDQGWEYLILKTQLLCISIWCGFRWRLKVSLSFSVSHCALACRMMNLYTWCWCQREWGTDGALRSEERLRTPIGRRMQPNTITDIHSLFLQLKYEYRTVFFWIGKWGDGEVMVSYCWHLDFFMLTKHKADVTFYNDCVCVQRQNANYVVLHFKMARQRCKKATNAEQMKLNDWEMKTNKQ